MDNENKIPEEEIVYHFTIFEPSKKDLKVEYPELSKVEEFGMLSNKELLFVWLYSNKSSSYEKYSKNPSIKVKMCLKDAFDQKLDAEKRKRYENLEFEDKLKEAMARMRSFNPSLRMKNKLMLDKVYRNLELMASMDEEEEIIKGLPIEQKKQYADFAAKIISTLDDITDKLENAYGVRVKKQTNNKSEQDVPLMDIVAGQH
jgi:hypothetical protein